MTEGIRASRGKDYANPFRKMVYEDEEEMDTVLGPLEDSSFLHQTQADFESYQKRVDEIIASLDL